MKHAFSILTTLFWLAANGQVEIHVYGAMSNIMRKGDLSAAVDVDAMAKKNLYALGPAAGLKGEIMVLDSVIYTTAISGDALQNKRYDTKAAMLVYGYVSGWHQLEKQVKISNIGELERLIEQAARETGMDVGQPFVFKIEAKAKSLSYHVIDWKEGVTHTMGNHKQFAMHKKEEDRVVVLLGFYSDQHHGIFTHHATNMHVHVLDRSTENVGHLDDIILVGSVKLYLSKK